MSDKPPKPLGPLTGPSIDSRDPRFAACVGDAVAIERLWTGGIWVEGPAWLAASRRLVWSDIPNYRMLSFDERSGMVSTFRQPASGANGNTIDGEGRLVTCEQYTRRITRTETDGAITVIADGYDGKRFTAPNDVVVKSDGSIWFTDPDYGKSPHYEGEKELAGCHVYRVDAATGAVRQMTTDMVMPNGLAFSPDESVLYIIDTGSTHRADGPNHIRRFTVGLDGTLGGGEIFAVDYDEGKFFDGLRVDAEGRLWCGTGKGVRCYLPDGTRLGSVLIPERVSNLTFGGPDNTRLYMTGTSSLYACTVKARGISGR